jgi:hypothetical protein
MSSILVLPKDSVIPSLESIFHTETVRTWPVPRVTQVWTLTWESSSQEGMIWSHSVLYLCTLTKDHCLGKDSQHEQRRKSTKRLGTKSWALVLNHSQKDCRKSSLYTSTIAVHSSLRKSQTSAIFASYSKTSFTVWATSMTLSLIGWSRNNNQEMELEVSFKVRLTKRRRKIYPGTKKCKIIDIKQQFLNNYSSL